MSQSYPSAQPPPEPEPPPAGPGWADAPRRLRPVVVLLVINLALSIVLTIVTLLARHSIVTFQLDHRHITDPQQRRALEDGYTASIIGRVVGNIVISIGCEWNSWRRPSSSAAMLYVVTRPAVRAHFAAHLPGRNVRRLNRPR